MGLINFITSSANILTEVTAYAERISGNAPLTVAAAKAAVNTWERGGDAEDIANVKSMVDACFDSADYKEGRQAFASKRKPRFKGV